MGRCRDHLWSRPDIVDMDCRAFLAVYDRTQYAAVVGSADAYRPAREATAASRRQDGVCGARHASHQDFVSDNGPHSRERAVVYSKCRGNRLAADVKKGEGVVCVYVVFADVEYSSLDCDELETLRDAVELVGRDRRQGEAVVMPYD